MPSTIFVTGGAGFIRSALVRRRIADSHDVIATLARLTYAGNLDSLPPAAAEPYVAERYEAAGPSATA